MMYVVILSFEETSEKFIVCMDENGSFSFNNISEREALVHALIFDSEEKANELGQYIADNSLELFKDYLTLDSVLIAEMENWYEK